MLIDHPHGQYRFLKGIAPYSCGVVAHADHEILHVTLARSLPWRVGFQRIEQFLADAHVARTALCGIQLRCPAPYTMREFSQFNDQYLAVLKEWKLLLGGVNPVARTNVSPQNDPPSEPELFAFSYVKESPLITVPTFLVAGAGELREGILKEQNIVRKGECTSDAINEKADFVMDVMTQRLDQLMCRWEQVSRVNVYTIHPVDDVLETIVLPRLGPSRRHGVHRYHARPPVLDIEFEMDMRGVRSEQLVEL